MCSEAVHEGFSDLLLGNLSWKDLAKVEGGEKLYVSSLLGKSGADIVKADGRKVDDLWKRHDQGNLQVMRLTWSEESTRIKCVVWLVLTSNCRYLMKPF